MSQHEISRETRDKIVEAMKTLAQEVFRNTGAVVTLIDIRAGFDKHGQGGVGIGVQTIGCQHAEDLPRADDRRSERPYTPASELVADLLRRLKPRDTRGN